MGERPQLSDRRLHVGLDLVDHAHRVFRIVLDRVVRETELDRQRDQVLLSAVVQVSLELATLGVAGGDDAGRRVLELLVADAQSSMLAWSAVSSCTLWRRVRSAGRSRSTLCLPTG